MSERLQKLEHTIMELGSEIYRLRHDLKESQKTHHKVMTTLRGIRSMLDEKGLVTSEEFETAVDLQKILEQNEAMEARDGDATAAAPQKRTFN